jgi:hypothetical protein
MSYADRQTRNQYMRNYRENQREKRGFRASPLAEKKILISIRLEESIAARVSRMVVEASATGKYPWRTPGEFYRGLVKRGLEFLKDHNPSEWAELEPILRLRSQLDAMTTQRTEAQGFVARTKQEIAELLRMGAKDMAAQLYVAAMGTAHKMPPTVYRDWMIDELKGKYHYLARDGVKGVAFTDRRAKEWDRIRPSRRKAERLPTGRKKK